MVTKAVYQKSKYIYLCHAPNVPSIVFLLKCMDNLEDDCELSQHGSPMNEFSL